jgi:MtN3 and saliva related transmembrane protein
MPPHYHRRARREPYPSQRLWMRVLDIVVYIVGILGPLATIPQLYQIYSTHDAMGVSFITWAMYAVFDLPWVIYAFVHKEPPLIICYLLWFIFNILVAVGALLYAVPACCIQ